MQKLSKADLDSGASVSSVFITKSRKTSSGWKLPEGAFVFRLTSSLDKLSSGSVPLCSGWRWWRWKKVRMRDASRLFAAKSLQSRPTLCDPIDGSPPGSPVPGILQARTLEWVAISFSNAWKWKVKEREVAQLYPTLSDPMDCSLPGSFIHRIFQARVLEWGAIAFSVVWEAAKFVDTSSFQTFLSSLPGLGSFKFY